MENEQNQEFELDQIETTEVEHEAEDLSEAEETITVPKSKFNAIKRKAIAYDANKAEPKTQPITNRSTDEKWRTKMELRVDGYDDDAIDFLMKNGGKKALENPYIAQTVQTMKTMKAAENAAISNDTGKSAIDRKYSPAEFAKLPHQEQLKVMSELN